MSSGSVFSFPKPFKLEQDYATFYEIAKKKYKSEELQFFMNYNKISSKYYKNLFEINIYVPIYNIKDFKQIDGVIQLNFIKDGDFFINTTSQNQIDHIYISAPYTNNKFDSLIFINSTHILFNQNIIENEFTQQSSSFKQTFQEKFSLFYDKDSKMSNQLYLLTSSYQTSDLKEFQITILSINFISCFQQKYQKNIHFTTITKVPSKFEISENTVAVIKNQLGQLYIEISVFTFLILPILSLYIYDTSKKITKPLIQLREKVKQISEGNLLVQIKVPKEGQWQEIDELFKSFECLNILIKCGDDKNYPELNAETLIKYSNAYLLFKQMKNTKGMGIVLNNMGNIHMKIGRMEEAISSYKESLNLVQEELKQTLQVESLYLFYNIRPAKGGWQSVHVKKQKTVKLVNMTQKTYFENILANRSYQYAQALLERIQKSNSKLLKNEYLDYCIDSLCFTEKIDQIQGKYTSRMVLVQIQLCESYLQKAKLQNSQFYYYKAISHIEKAQYKMEEYKNIFHLFLENIDLPPIILEQQLLMQKGLFLKDAGIYQKACKVFTKCLQLGNIYEPKIREVCLKNLDQIFQDQRIEQKNVQKLLFLNQKKGQKDIVFVLDFSASMQVYKNLVISKFLSIFEVYMQDQDRLAFIKYNENVDVVFELNEKGKNTDFLKYFIQNQVTVMAQGESAFRQAVYEAIKLFQKANFRAHSKWIVVFTDGDDNCSQISEKKLGDILQNQEGCQTINLIIIGFNLGACAIKNLSRLCKCTKEGIFINAKCDINDEALEIQEIDIAFQAITNKLYGNNDLNYIVEMFE